MKFLPELFLGPIFENSWSSSSENCVGSIFCIRLDFLLSLLPTTYFFPAMTNEFFQIFYKNFKWNSGWYSSWFSPNLIHLSWHDIRYQLIQLALISKRKVEWLKNCMQSCLFMCTVETVNSLIANLTSLDPRSVILDKVHVF